MSEKNIDHRIEIGNRIAEIRKQRGLTQTELSEITGLQQVNISKIEKGKYNVSIDILNKLCTALECEIKIEAAE